MSNPTNTDEFELIRQELRFYRSMADAAYSDVEDGIATVEQFHTGLGRLENSIIEAIITKLRERDEFDASDTATLKRIVKAYQEDTAKSMTTDGVNYATTVQTNPPVNSIIKWLEDNEAWYSIKPRVVTIEVKDE